MSIIKHLIDAAKGKHPLSSARSGHWPTVRKNHLAQHPTCAACGGSDKLEVHHIQPFHLRPELETSADNLITLCESGKGGVNCHLVWGHISNFRSFNTTVTEDSAAWRTKLQTRPLALNQPKEEA